MATHQNFSHDFSNTYSLLDALGCFQSKMSYDAVYEKHWWTLVLGVAFNKTWWLGDFAAVISAVMIPLLS